MLDGTEPRSLFEELGEIHRREIHSGFLSTLGPKFLTLLYEVLSSGKHSFCIIESDDEQVRGFIVGATDTSAVYKEFVRRAGFRGLMILAPKLLSFERIKRILETIFYPKSKHADNLPEPEILNFCVRSELQGYGIGGRLFSELCREFESRHITEIRIVTGESQVSAQRFYEAKGAILAKKFEVHKDRASRVYLYKIQPNS